MRDGLYLTSSESFAIRNQPMNDCAYPLCTRLKNIARLKPSSLPTGHFTFLHVAICSKHRALANTQIQMTVGVQCTILLLSRPSPIFTNLGSHKLTASCAWIAMQEIFPT